MFFWCTLGTQKAGPPRNEALLEAVLKHTKATRHPWLVACDANVCPEDSGKESFVPRELMHVVAPKEASTCRSEDSKGEWIERSCDYFIACNGLKENSQMKVVEDVESVVETERRRCRNGMSRTCRRCCLVTVGDGCQEEALKKRVEKKRREKWRMEKKEESGMKSLKKWLNALRERQARTKMPSRPHKEQSSKVSSGIGTALVENRKLAKEGPDGRAMD